MSQRVNLGASLIGTVLLIIIGVVVITGSQTNEQRSIETKAQSVQNNKDIQTLNATITKKIDNIDAVLTDFIKDRNAAFNQTFEYQKAILDLQLNNEKNIINNLSDHRVISNLSDQNQTQILYAVLNATHTLTSDEYNEQAENKVASIIGNMSEDHELIFKALNITKTDTNGEKKQLGQLVKEFLEAQKDNSNEPKGSKVK